MFFEKFREALVRLPAGLIRPGPAASPEQIAGVEAVLKMRLPPSFASFLESFDGAELFHEAVLLGGAGPAAPRRLVDMNVPLRPGELTFAEAAGGDRFVFHVDGRVLRVHAEAEKGEKEERWVAGGDFSRWLDGVVAYHRVLYAADGEFAPDAFEADGSEIVPLMALRQTERALRACPDSAEWHHERGVALRRLGRLAEAKDAFAGATALDPENPWAHFDLGRAALDLGPASAREAGAAFEAAAKLDGGEAASRLWVWAARAAMVEAAPERIALCRRAALALEPALPEQLRRALEAAAGADDPQELVEATALLDALEGAVPPGRMRLAVLSAGAHEQHHEPAPTRRNPKAPDGGGSKVGRGDDAVSGAPEGRAHRTPPQGPRRPDPAAPPRSAGRRPARRR